MTTKQTTNYLGPFITMVVLFFFVGFLTTANGQFQVPLQAAFLKDAGNLKNTLATLISFSWFLAYPIMGGVGSSWVSKHGYKGTLVRALLVMVVGLCIFAASSTQWLFETKINIASAIVPIGFFVFLLGSFVVGSAATILQVVINPYLTASEVKGTQAVQRLNIGGSANSIGTTVAPYFVTGVVFGGMAVEDVNTSQLLIPFLGIALIIAIVTFIVTKLSLPDIKGTRVEAGQKLEKSIWSFRHLTLGVIAIFFYVGVEVAIGANLNMYAKDLIDKGVHFATFGMETSKLIALMATLYWGGMLVGRLISSGLSSISPKVQLGVTASLATILIIAAMILENPWLLVIVGLCHSVMWGSIFTLSVNKLGKYTSVGSGVFMIGVVGGAIIPLVQGGLADLLGGWELTWLLVIASELFILYYAISGSKVLQTGEEE